MVDTNHFAKDKNEEGIYIPVSYRFERDMDKESTAYVRNDTVKFDKDANDHYVCDDVDVLADTEAGRSALVLMIRNFFESQVQRLSILESYAKGKNYGINHGQRRIEKNKADYRITHDFGGYISRFATSYIISKPVTITYKGSNDDEGTNDLTDVEEVGRINDIDNLNKELGYDASVYGRALEFHYREKDSTDDLIVRIDPKEGFVIRDKTVKKKIIGYIHCPIYNDLIEITVYSDKSIYRFEPVDPQMASLKLKENGKTKNPRGQVPVVEWWNNRYRMGDFEKQIPSIDAYDAAQSDTANYMSDLNDAMLVLSGDKRFDREELSSMKDLNIIYFESGNDMNGNPTKGDAKYIYKQYDVSGVEAYKSRILDDLHLLSTVPKMTDDTFGTQAAIAMMWKLLGLKQLKEDKVSQFSKALRDRYRLIDKMRKENGGERINAENLTFTFHENLPNDVWSEIATYVENGGLISQQTLRENASFTDDKTEIQRLNEEDNQRMGLSPEDIFFKSNTSQSLLDDEQ